MTNKRPTQQTPERENVDTTPHLINGKEYYDFTQFAYLVRRHVSHISLLFLRGNKLRKLKGIRVGGKPFVEVDEVHEFPFDVRKVMNKNERLNVTNWEKLQ